jgi:hypothetical protein
VRRGLSRRKRLFFQIERDGGDPEIREQRALRQRATNDVISRLLGELGVGG